MAKAIIRVEKIKSKDGLSSVAAHNQRSRITENSDPSRRSDNEYLIGCEKDNVTELVYKKIGGHTIAKNAVIAVEMLLSVSPSYFQTNGKVAYREWDMKKVDAWKNVTLQWLKKNYDDNIVNCVLHLDETQPHIHAIIVPMFGKSGGLSYNQKFGGKKYRLSELQSNYSKEVSVLGIERGFIGSGATHKEMEELYGLLLEPLRSLPVFTMKSPTTFRPEPKPLGFFKRGDSEKKRFEDEVDAWNAENVYRDKYCEEFERFYENHLQQIKPYLARAGKVDVLVRQVDDLKQANSCLTSKNNSYYPVGGQFKETPLQDILVKMYCAELVNDVALPNNISRYVLNSREFYVKGCEWSEDFDGKMFNGAISLVVKIENIDPENYLDAVLLLSSVFGKNQALTDLHMAHFNKANEDASHRFSKPYPFPKIGNDKVTAARVFLADVCKISGSVVDEAISSSGVFVDVMDSLVFPRSSGGFSRQAMRLNRNGNDVKRREQFQDPEPYIVGYSKEYPELIIASTELEALVLRSIFPKSTVISINGCSYKTAVAWLRKAKKIVVTFDLSVQPIGINRDIIHSLSKDGIFSDLVTLILPSQHHSEAKSWLNLLRKMPSVGSEARPNLNNKVLHDLSSKIERMESNNTNKGPKM